MSTKLIIKETVKTHRNLGFTDEITECGCCGRVDLKGTYAIEDLLTGEIMYLGCVCAANRMNWSKKEFITRYKAEEKEQGEMAKNEFRNTHEYQAVEAYTKDSFAAIRRGEEPIERPDLFEAKNNVRQIIAAKYPLAHPVYLS